MYYIDNDEKFHIDFISNISSTTVDIFSESDNCVSHYLYNQTISPKYYIYIYIYIYILSLRCLILNEVCVRWLIVPKCEFGDGYSCAKVLAWFWVKTSRQIPGRDRA